ncbi:5-formyltetrahydrofolate cyclo-ligase [Leeuwenhoekiella marinoflava]|uniref:5-formyltetrahydrofolate cyclo-ligase n=2 Tax=Leeuwenhoekiella marinoflava TaxID=988 RepID=A0A4Q0PR85_9FLAO|nr:5-formyltetrahydrofolate cyclo-ligase [Leeuwenhoekiella marinoflava]RXG33149.1 5-formyltetrahydrofolate cyclo-ligase [Leeuwenhoekiella marinoflava]SHE40232.1 5-formyltetrahydrofolate cyclo-ligase [Leeuwenhoekiella marinoflava DSM 3653]
MDKAFFRKKYKSLRESLSLEECDNKSIDIANQLLKLPIWNVEFYHIFLTIEKLKEVNTDYILNILNGKDKNSVIAQSDFTNSTMRHFLLTDNTLIKVNNWGIPEPQGGIVIDPSQLDVVFVPLLAFDAKGNRLGYGKGFYDRFLSSCKPDCLKIGLSFFEAEKELPADNNDIKLTHCITPNKIHTF